MNIYIGNLSFTTEEGDLKDLFKEYGNVDQVKVIRDFHTGNSKGFGFIEMGNEAGTAAISELNGKEFQGKVIVVNEAQPKTTANNRR